jgi:hypothetical protein
LAGGNLAEDGGLSFPVWPGIFRFSSEFGSRTARSLLLLLLECGACPLICDATAPGLATGDAELAELWPLPELEPPVDPWLLELPELWLLAELGDEDDDELDPLDALLCEPPAFDELLEVVELFELLSWLLAGAL